MLLYGDPAAPVVLAGHLDTVPAQDNFPGRIADGVVHGLGASDMKGGVAVMIELARAGAPGRYLFFTREELPGVGEPAAATCSPPASRRGTELAVVLEPTDCILHAGCLGNIKARVTFHGESAHSARPWTGVNAIHELDPRPRSASCGLEPLDVELDGLIVPRGRDAVRVEGGIASNVIPAEASVELNFRYAPGRSREDARRACASSSPHGDVEILSNSPPRRRRSAIRSRRSCASSCRRSQPSRRGRRSRSSPSRDRRDQLRPGCNRVRAQASTSRSRSRSLERCYETLHAFLDSVSA